MTIYEEYLAAVGKEYQRHRKENAALLAALKKKQATCKHKYGEVQEGMFYALGQTAPGKQCLECGAKCNAERQ